MEISAYSIESKKYESTLDTSYKKGKGIYYTDIELSSKMIEFLKIPSNAYILDPCCGTGSFIVAADNLGYKNVYGVDIDVNAVTLCKNKNNLSNITVLDTLSNNGKDVLKKLRLTSPVDFLIGNPPYAPIAKDITIDTLDYLFLRNVKDSGSNLFIAAIYRAFELTKAEGVISYIIPKNFLHVSSYSILRKLLLNEKTILSIIDIGSYFKSVRGEQIIITIKNQTTENSCISIYKYANNEFVKKLEVPQDFFKNEILLFSNETDFSIYKKLESSYKKFDDICKGYVGRGRSKSLSAITGKDIQKFSFKSTPVPRKGNRVFIQNIYSAESGIIASFGGDLEASETVTIFTDGDEKMCRYILGVLHSRLCNYFLLKFCYNNSKLTMHADAKYLKKLPLIINDYTFTQTINIVKMLESVKYMSNEWFDALESLNDIIYKTYNISIDERKHIDSQMKEIQSEKWDYDKRR
ncbi:HsdM family class I SAM-dependent methyltransferase [Macellibacteroides fermentans]|uniref:site-specific DNA-methyltransferase (adenine-specific) n=1 Tax=Parabacteroides chartae TaxID=1037355 RepID=A0A1T5A4M2_9BACT|nr:N-6 DNA methylase [Parabacteroides chartae]SKB29677.1 N-6 DNA Methylase [Parabacteroides chartae]